MKKTITSILALALAMGMSAQSFKILQGEREITNGESFEVGYSKKGPIVSWESSSIYSAEGGSFTCEVSTASDNWNKLQACCGGVCEGVTGVNEVLKKTFDLEAGKTLDMQIHRVSGTLASQSGDLVANVKIYPTAKPDEAFTYSPNFVVMSAEDVAGIEDVATNHEYVKVSGGELTYSGNGQLGIYTILGNCLKSVYVQGEGAVDITTLPAGIYVYRLGKLSGKFTVK